ARAPPPAPPSPPAPGPRAPRDPAAEALGGSEPPEFVRIAVTLERIDRFQLPTAPPKKKDKRSALTDTRTVQAEALPPDVLQAEIVAEIVPRMDLGLLGALNEREREVRELLLAGGRRGGEHDGRGGGARGTTKSRTRFLRSREN